MVSTVVFRGDGGENVSREGHLLGHLFVLDTAEPYKGEVFLELRSNLFQSVDSSFGFGGIGGVDEEPYNWHTTVHVRTVVLRSNFVDHAEGVALDEFGNFFIFQSAAVHGSL